jgi:hypothetical protein
VKVKLQQLLFPEGLLYERQNDHYRTTKVNEILELISSFSRGIIENKNEQIEKKFNLSASVALRVPISNQFNAILSQMAGLIHQEFG